MPKLKTKKGVAKRFRLTKRGKIMYSKEGKRHLLSSKRKSRKRKLRGQAVLEGTQEKKYIKRMLPYG
ncbi:MAG: 50S ribosomal protein L35 [Candidatus Omnitrophota bacterium]